MVLVHVSAGYQAFLSPSQCKQHWAAPPLKKSHTQDTAETVRKRKKCQGSLFTTVVYKKGTAHATAGTTPSMSFTGCPLLRSPPRAGPTPGLRGPGKHLTAQVKKHRSLQT